MIVKDIIDELINVGGFKQSEIAEAAGVTQSTINKYRNGRLLRPNFEAFMKLNAMHKDMHNKIASHNS